MKYILFLFAICLVACSALRNYKNREEEVYYEKCTGCHRPHERSEYDSDEWHSIMKKMSKKAHLSDGENRMIINYLTDQQTK